MNISSFARVCEKGNRRFAERFKPRLVPPYGVNATRLLGYSAFKHQSYRQNPTPTPNLQTSNILG